ncbi:sodium- and chloride-dependent creatine transporter 1 [Nilaparvata lugens]|uniref:sodium- and chloride-dependent creatine transporter 1 n=1 Tax=Nilaparvata lugens TaxID=108931 RepID=UPI00193E63FA|nr:sodium- and chloride-dependent creatine transporter 1 [Nilaparvata lugens]
MSNSNNNNRQRSYSRNSSIGIANEYLLPGGSLASYSGSISREYRFCAIEHPSVKSHTGKESAFFDPSKAEADKTCQDYVKDAEELHKKLKRKLQGKPYNQKDLIKANLILTSMRNEVILRNVISDLVSHHQSSSKKRRVLRLELQETERRANWYHSALQRLIADADRKEKLDKARTYISYGTLLKISVILQFNLLDKVPYPTERYHSHGIIQVILYGLLLIFVALPIHLAVRTISQYSKSLVINSWNFCPFFKGVGCITLLVGGYYMLQSVNVVSVALYMFIDVLRGSVGWSTCPNGENEHCSSSASNYTRINCNETNESQIPMIMNSGTVYYYTVLEEAFNLSNKSIKYTGLLCVFSIWALICTFMLIGFERFIKVVEILFIPIIVTAVLLLIALYNGNEPMGLGIQNLFSMVTNDPSVVQRNMVLFDVLLSVQVVNGVINFLAAHAPQNENPIVDTYIFGLLDLFIHYTVTIFVFAAAGFLQGYYNAVHCSCFLIYRDITILALIPEFLSRVYMGKYLVVLFLVFLILTQIIYIVIVGFTIVKSVTDLIVEGAAHMYAVFVVVASGVAMNFFLHLSNSPDNHLSQKVSSGIQLSALFAVAVFLFAMVILYSTSKLCSNIAMMIGARPGPLCDTLIKLSFLLYFCLGYSNIIYVMINPTIKDWGFLFELFFVVTVPLVFSAMFKISESSRNANSPDNHLSQKVSSGIQLSALFAVAVFLFAMVILYSTSKLCSNIAMMIGARPGPLCDTLIKLAWDTAISFM